MGCLLYYGRPLAEQQYSDLLSPSAWENAAAEFTRQACSLMGQVCVSQLQSWCAGPLLCNCDEEVLIAWRNAWCRQGCTSLSRCAGCSCRVDSILACLTLCRVHPRAFAGVRVASGRRGCCWCCSAAKAV
eukprot:364682-Chlamydomonas_euryale.AAC.14